MARAARVRDAAHADGHERREDLGFRETRRLGAGRCLRECRAGYERQRATDRAGAVTPEREGESAARW
jgi:hypothetical protein